MREDLNAGLASEESDGSGEAGFTLIEVLVSFAILSLVLIVLFQSAGEGARNMNYVRAKTEALHLAQSKLATVGHQIPLQAGKVQGEMRDGYVWTLDIIPYAQQNRANDSMLLGYWVEVIVSRKNERGQPLASLRTLKLMPNR